MRFHSDVKKNAIIIIIISISLLPSVVKILRAKNIKINQKLEWLEVRFFIGGNKALMY